MLLGVYLIVIVYVRGVEMVNKQGIFYLYSLHNFRPAKKMSYRVNDYIEIDSWVGVDPRKSLWVYINGYDRHVVLDSNVILKLADEIRRIQKDKKLCERLRRNGY